VRTLFFLRVVIHAWTVVAFGPPPPTFWAEEAGMPGELDCSESQRGECDRLVRKYCKDPVWMAHGLTPRGEETFDFSCFGGGI
jgi:hypothetical protein